LDGELQGATVFGDRPDDETRLVGLRCGPFPAALRLLEQRLAGPLPVIEARFPLQEGD
jgi:hypothetical protein